MRAVFLGAGPAGTGPLVNAQRRGLLPDLLDAGIAVADRQDRMGAGSIGRYLINSDTTGGTFLECLTGGLARVLDSEPGRRFAPFRRSAAPLPLVGELLAEIGRALRNTLDTHPVSRFLPGTRAVSIRRVAGGGFATTLTSGGGEMPVEVPSQYVVSALGGHQDRVHALTAPIVPGVRLADGYADRVVLTEQVLTAGGPERLAKMLATAGHRRVVIIGGSHSAFAAAWMLLHRVGGFEPGDIEILHRRPPRIFYPTAADAHADGYTDFGPDDLCPLTDRVYRLAGLRWDSRELLRRIRAAGGAPAENRIRLVRLDPGLDDGVSARLDRAAVIIPAFGYRPVTVPLYDTDGREVPLAGSGPLVDDRCRILDAGGAPVPGLFGIGLASGFVLDEALGGEPSFTGQTNGLWLYQNGIGERILDQLLASPAA